MRGFRFRGIGRFCRIVEHESLVTHEGNTIVRNFHCVTTRCESDGNSVDEPVGVQQANDKHEQMLTDVDGRTALVAQKPPPPISLWGIHEFATDRPGAGGSRCRLVLQDRTYHRVAAK